MPTRSLALLISLTLFVSLSAAGQSRGGGGGAGGHATTSSMVQPGTNAANAAALGTGNNLDTTIVRPNSADNEAKVEFRSQTILVQVPVVVTDKSGNHVHGLNKEDFHLLENGKPVNVSVFEEQTAENSPIAVPATKAGEFRNLTLDGPTPRNIVVVVLDTVNTPFLDQTYGRRALVKFLAQNVSSGQVLSLMIITSSGLKVVQGLTGNPDTLLQALKKVSGQIPALDNLSQEAQESAALGGTSGPGGAPEYPSAEDPVIGALDHFIEVGDAADAQFLQQNAIETTMNAFLGIANSLSGVPGRKSLIWATGSFPFNMDSPASVPGGYLSVLYERTMLALNEAQVSVYPVDVRGLVGNGNLGSARSNGSAKGLDGSRQITNRMWVQQAKFDTLNEFADMTGGKAFYNTNDVSGSYRRAAADGSSYYMLGYYLDTHNTKAGWRKLQVKVGRKDVEVRARTGFFVTNATMDPILTRSLDMKNALHSPIEGTGVPMTVQWLNTATAGDKVKATFLAQMAPGSLTFDSTRPDYINFDFAVLAFDKDGKEAAQSAQNFAKPVPEAQMASVRANGVGFRNALELSPGKYTVRFVVRDNLTGKVGSITAPLVVN